MEINQSTATALEKRISRLRKAYARGHGRKLSFLEATAVNRAAKLTAIAEFSTSAPGVSLTDVVRLDHAAERARAAMARTLAKARDRVPSLEELGLAV
jgi:hypothetical protein